MKHFEPQQFDFTTTNQKEYKPFTLQSRPQTSKPKVDAVKTKAFPAHFETQNKKEYIKHEYRVPEVDLIPYP